MNFQEIKTTIGLGDSNRVIEYLKNGGDVSICDDIDKCTIAHIASIYNSDSLIEEYIKHGGSIDAVDINGNNFAMKAAMNGNLQIVGIYIENNGDINAQNNFSETIGHLSAQSPYASYDLVKQFAVYGGDINAQDINGNTILHIAAQNGDVEIFNYIQNSFGITETRNNDGYLPIHIAAQNRQMEIFQLFLLNDKHNILSQTNRGDLIGHIAAYSKSTEICTYWLEHIEDDTINDLNNDGKTIAQLAVETGNLELLKEIVTNEHYDINTISKNNENILHQIAKTSEYKFMKTFKRHSVPFDLYVSQDDNGNTPLHIAAQYGYKTDFIDIFSSSIIDSNIKNGNGLTFKDIQEKMKIKDIVESNIDLIESAKTQAIRNADFQTEAKLLSQIDTLEHIMQYFDEDKKGVKAEKIIEYISIEANRSYTFEGSEETKKMLNDILNQINQAKQSKRDETQMIDLDRKKALEDARSRVIEHPEIRMVTTEYVDYFNKEFGANIDYDDLLLEVASNEQYKRQQLNLAVRILGKIEGYINYAKDHDITYNGLSSTQEIDAYINENKLNEKENKKFKL